MSNNSSFTLGDVKISALYHKVKRSITGPRPQGSFCSPASDVTGSDTFWNSFSSHLCKTTALYSSGINTEEACPSPYKTLAEVSELRLSGLISAQTTKEPFLPSCFCNASPNDWTALRAAETGILQGRWQWCKKAGLQTAFVWTSFSKQVLLILISLFLMIFFLGNMFIR